MSFFDNLTGFAGDVGGFAGQLGQSLSQIGTAIGQVQHAWQPNAGWGTGITLPPVPAANTQPIGPPTSDGSPLLLLGLIGLAIFVATRK